jgi:hypothetical protein
MPGYQDLYISQGDNFQTQITLADDYGTAYNLLGFHVASQARTSYFAANATLTFVTTIVDSSNGVVQLAANSASTANLTKTLVYDVLLKDTSNNISKILEGRVFVDLTSTNIYSF